jgi:hypothetical protein
MNDDSTPADGSIDATSATDASIDGPARDGSSLAACSFNVDCPADERCECSEMSGCRCTIGPRGARRFGEPCANGNDCASALCVEGPSGFLCSDQCRGPSDCMGMLPRCVSVPTVGQFCARLPPDAGGTDAGDAGREGGASSDAGSCSGACATTLLMGTFGATRGNFDRAQHGRAGTDAIRIEAHFGGNPMCPSASSPTPDRTLVIVNVRANGSMAPQTYADGVRATLFDFRGLFTMAPLLRATDVRVTPRYVDRGAAVSYDVTATFPGGTIVGGLFAGHCPSLDE